MEQAKYASIAAAAALLLVTIGLPAQAEDTYYRWINEEGISVNSDRPPPPGIEYEEITTGTGLLQPKAVQEAPPPPEPTNAENAPREKAVPAQTKAAPKDPEACNAARQNLDTLTTQARIRMRDSEGTFRFLTAEEKTSQRELAEAAIARECE